MARTSKSKSSGGSPRGPPARKSTPVEGVELAFVCGGVPVLALDKSSLFSDNASWMLQSALSSTGKADSLYDYCDDKDVLQECRRELGLRHEEVGLVRVRQQELRHVRAVGTSGKRSVMLALVVALAHQEGFDLKAMCREMRAYGLDERDFLALIEQSRPGAESPGAKSPPRSGGGDEEEAEAAMEALADEGIELELLGGSLPVLGLAKDSVLQEHASWLIQTASGTSGKADAVYEYFSDREVLRQCARHLGLGEHEVGSVQLRGAQQVRAVGTCGKRSSMLALVVAIVLAGKMTPAQLMREVRGYDAALESSVRALLRAALSLAGRPTAELKEEAAADRKKGGGSDWGGSDWGYWDDRADQGAWGGWDSGWSGKRKWVPMHDDRHDSSPEESQKPSSAPAGKKKGRSKAARQETASATSLDRQLNDYWGDEDD